MSKIGLPILYFAGGEGEYVVKNHNLGWVIKANDVKGLQNFLDDLNWENLSLISGKQIQENALKSFDFSKQFFEFISLFSDL